MRNITVSLALALTVLSCSRESKPENGVVRLGVNLEDVSTKAAMGSSELLSTAKVNIYYADFSGLVASYKYGSLPSEIYLPASEYRVDVLAGEDSKDQPRRANFEQISYKGSSTFTVEGGKNVTVQVDANVSSTITKVIFDGTVSANFKSGYTLSIGPDADNMLTYSASQNSAPAYFLMSGVEEKKLSWTFSGERTSTGASVQKNGVIEDVKAGKVYELKIKYTLKEGTADFDIYVDTDLQSIDETIVFEPVSTGLSASAAYEIWAAHATVHADIDESEFPDPTKIKFTYSSDGSNWLDQNAERTGEGTYAAILKGLNQATQYSYKLKIGTEIIGDAMTFTTASAPVVPNGDFEESVNDYNYDEFYSPNSSNPDWRTPWWGSGNGSSSPKVDGSAKMGIKICMVDTDVYHSGHQSAKLKSSAMVGILAAGNLFSGYFGGLVGTSGGKVYFGRPFTGRPTALKFWAKYSSGKIDVLKGYPADNPVTKNDYDRARVQVALGTWNSRTYGGDKSSPILVNTTDESTFINYTTDKSTIAYAEEIIMCDAQNSANVWKEYTLKLNYKDEKTIPTHIVISCAASMFGDYFTGHEGSTLWVDEMELVYE